MLANEVIEHVAHPDQFLARLATLVRPGGLIFLSTPNGGYLHTGLPTFAEVEDPNIARGRAIQAGGGLDGNLSLLENEELRSLARLAGLEVREIRNFTSPILAGDFGAWKLLRRVPPLIVWSVNRVLEHLPRRIAHVKFLMHTGAVLANHVENPTEWPAAEQAAERSDLRTLR